MPKVISSISISAERMAIHDKPTLFQLCWKFVAIFICVIFFVIGFFGLFLTTIEMDIKIVDADKGEIGLVKTSSACRMKNFYFHLTCTVFSCMAMFGIVKRRPHYMIPFLVFQLMLSTCIMVLLFVPEFYNHYMHALSVIMSLFIFGALQVILLKLLAMFTKHKKWLIKDATDVTRNNENETLAAKNEMARPINIIINMDVPDATLIPAAIKCAMTAANLNPEKVQIKAKAKGGVGEVNIPFPFRPDTIITIPPPYESVYDETKMDNGTFEEECAPPPYTAHGGGNEEGLTGE